MTKWTKTEDGVYRAIVNDRAISVWRNEPGSWSYGTYGARPASTYDDMPAYPVLDDPASPADYACDYGAPSVHLAKADAIMLANCLAPADLPTREMRNGRYALGWHFNPAARTADIAAAKEALLLDVPLVFKWNDLPIRRSAAMARVIDAWLSFHRTAGSAIEYFESACLPGLEGNIARNVVQSDVPGLIIEGVG